MEERAKVLAFVDRYNEEHGRGGQSEATRRFKLSQLTISNWRLQSGHHRSAARTRTGAPTERTIARLREVHQQIEAQEKLLERLKASFRALKASL